MSLLERTLSQEQGTTATEAIFTSGTVSTIVITKILACAATTGSHTFSLFFDRAGAAAGDGNIIFNDQSIKNKETFQASVWLPMNTTTAALSGNVSTSNVITFTVSGMEIF